MSLGERTRPRVQCCAPSRNTRLARANPGTCCCVKKPATAREGAERNTRGACAPISRKRRPLCADIHALSACGWLAKQAAVNSLSPAAGGPPPLSAPQQLEQKPVQRWRWWIHLILIGAYPVITASLSWGRAGTRGPALSQSARGLLIVCGIELLLFSVVFGLGWLASRATRDQLLWRWRPGYWVVPLGIGYSVAIRFAVGMAVAAVSVVLLLAQVTTVESLQQFMMVNRPDVESLVDVSVMRKDPLYFWLTLTLVSFVVAGLREEVWRSGFLAALRALWPSTFASRRGQILAVALIAIVFGVAHLGMGVIAAGIAGFLGLLLGIIMVLHQSIWPAVIAHGFFDATSMALLPWAMEKIQQLA